MKARLSIACLLHLVLAVQARGQGEPTPAEQAFSAAWLANTSATSAGEDLLIAAMFAQRHQPDRTADFLGITLAEPELNKLRYSLLAYHCLLAAADVLCADAAYSSELIALDGNNMEPQLYAMLRLLDAGDGEAALRALRQGNLAAQTNNYYFDKLRLLRSRLAAAGYPAQQLNGAAEVLAGAADMYAFYSRVLAACAENSVQGTQWQTECLKLGRRLEEEGKTAMQNVFGFAIQRDALGESLADAEQRTAVLARRDAFNATLDEASALLPWWNDTSLKTDELYRAMAEIGEIDAVRQALRQREQTPGE